MYQETYYGMRGGESLLARHFSSNRGCLPVLRLPFAGGFGDAGGFEECGAALHGRQRYCERCASGRRRAAKRVSARRRRKEVSIVDT